MQCKAMSQITTVIYYKVYIIRQIELSGKICQFMQYPFAFQAVLQTSHSRIDSYYLKIVI